MDVLGFLETQKASFESPDHLSAFQKYSFPRPVPVMVAERQN